MRKFFETEFMIAAVLSLFTLAFPLIGHGPTMPPDPWAGFAALRLPAAPPSGLGTDTADHGPTMPPDPWAGVV